jgi:hypothetical protein
VRGLQVRETQESGSQTLGVPPHTPLVHTSSTVQLLVSLHRVPSATLTNAQVPVDAGEHLWEHVGVRSDVFQLGVTRVQ